MKIRKIKKTIELGVNLSKSDIHKKNENAYGENYIFDNIFKEELNKLNKQDKKKV